MNDDIAGIVLAGGKSSRMGVNKALIKLEKDSPTFLNLATAKMSMLCSVCYVSCAKGKIYPDYNCIEDEVCGQGPAGGILACLDFASKNNFAAIFVLACDLPLITLGILQNLLTCFRQKPSLMTAYQSEQKRIEPQVAIYSTGCLPFFKDAVAKGRRSLWNIISADKQNLLTYDEKLACCFTNCNTPEELKLARKLNS